MSRLRTPRTNRSPASFELLERRALMSAAVDLSVIDAGFSDAANQPAAVPGARFEIEPTFQHTGSPISRVDCIIYLSPTPSLTDQSIVIGSGFVDAAHGASDPQRALPVQGTLPSSITPGTWYPIVVVDPADLIPESDESNNTLVADPITVVVPRDDLTVPAGVSAPTPTPAGTTLEITGPYEPNWRQYPVTYAFALSADDIPGNADDVLLGTYTSLPSGSWHPGGPVAIPMILFSPTHTFPLPADLPAGTYHLVTTVDPDNAIAEPNETNNSALGPTVTLLSENIVDLTALAPDIGPSPYINPGSLSPLHPTPGSQISVGAFPYSKFGQAARPKVAFVLSSDDTYGNVDDILLGSYDTAATTPLPPGLVVCFTYPETVDVTLPTTLAPGHYKLFAVVDPDNQIPEQDESNNVSPATDLTVFASTPIDQQPPTSDPTTTSPNAPTPPSTDKPVVQAQSTPTFRNITAGSSAKTSVTLANPTAKSLTATYKVTFYLSSDPTLSRADKAIGSQTLTVTLRPHQTKSLQITYRIPANTAAGHRYLITTVAPVRNTRITTQSAPPPTPLNILPQSTSLKARPISSQILNPDDTRR